jgi:hypothetical protein
MGYPDHDDPGGDAPGAFRAFHHESADGIRYADSGVLPDDGPRLADAPRPDGDWFPDGAQIRDHGRFADGGRFPGAGSRADADTGVYPVIDRYAGYERLTGDQAGDRPTAAPGQQPFTRVYARPADPWEASSSGREPGWTRDHGRRPAAGYPDSSRTGHSDDPSRGGWPEDLSRGGYPAEVTLGRRLAGLRLDRWIIAGGGLAAAVAVVIAFATTGGSTAIRPATTQSATAHVTQPACTTPRTGGLPVSP